MSKMTVNISFELDEDSGKLATIELEHTKEDLHSIHKKAIELAADLLGENYNLRGVAAL
jgi:hypothetical protein